MLPPTRSVRHLAALLLAVAAALVLPACGSSPDAGRPDEAAKLLLDFHPGAVHAGIYLAMARGFDEAEGVRLSVEIPGSGTDAVKSLLSGQARFAVLDLHDLAIARAKGRDLVAVMALVQRPLAAVVAAPDVPRPRALEHRTVGVTGLPSDTAVLDSLVRGDGGDPAKVRRVTIGFDAVPALLGGRVSGATAFWNAEGVALQARRPGVHVFRVDEYGAPAYPELVLVTTRATTQDSPAVVRATVTALQRGYRSAISDPDSAVSELQAAVPGLDRALVAKQLDAVSETFQAASGQIGTFDVPALRTWAAWEARFGIVKTAPEVADMFNPRFAEEGAAKATEDSG
ncbi:MAG: transporter substrate-binding protein [Solirubrobacterales bacterium]|nr:transporter substrate-binding protein [Solirubrobacterales bacterium]